MSSQSENPTFSEGPPVPLMVEGQIDVEILTRMFSELEKQAKIVNIREKGGPRVYASGAEPTLTESLGRLLSRSAKAVQLRYVVENQEWIDTIFTLQEGYRIVRSQAPSLT